MDNCPKCDNTTYTEGVECNICGYNDVCEREWHEVEEEWECLNDHTGCMWNDGHNACSHLGLSTTPLEDED